VLNGVRTRLQNVELGLHSSAPRSCVTFTAPIETWNSYDGRF